MKVLAIVPSLYDTSPGQRFRLEQWDPYLRELGVEIVYAPFEDKRLKSTIHERGRFFSKARHSLNAFRRRWNQVKHLGDFDIIYVFREAALFGPPVFERMVSRSGKPMIFDFDDAIYLRSEGSVNGYLNLLKFSGKTREICARSTHVMAGNEHLAAFARKFNDSVTIIPTTIDTNKYRIERHEKKGRLTIGWSGSFSTVLHLNTLRSALQRLATMREFTLRVVGTPAYDLEGVNVEAIQWQSATEIEDLGEIDIGVMPLPDEAWSRGKCGLKALQYMALGIPTVCSPVGVNASIIADGKNGSIAATEDEWIDRLTRLLDSAELREKLGTAGQATVEERFSARSQVSRVLEVFESTLKKARSETDRATSLNYEKF